MRAVDASPTAGRAIIGRCDESFSPARIRNGELLRGVRRLTPGLQACRDTRLHGGQRANATVPFGIELGVRVPLDTACAGGSLRELVSLSVSLGGDDVVVVPCCAPSPSQEALRCELGDVSVWPSTVELACLSPLHEHSCPGAPTGCDAQFRIIRVHRANGVDNLTQ